ncbi:MAG: AmmeMemoRadiSam system protein B [candidate division Zixibacteria bacterium]
MSDSDTTYVRPPAVAGQFYPDSPSELAKMIAGQFYAAPKPVIAGRPIAIISPHAGYVYSGLIAAKGYKILEGEEYSTVIVISPSHTISFDGVSAFAGKAYSTPFGQIPVDRELTEKIASGSDIIEISNTGHLTSGQRSEHALEVQLPFLQTTLRDFTLAALMMGDQDYKTCEALGNALASAIKGRDDVLIVASSDLSHFHDSDMAKRLDSGVIDRVRDFDYKGLSGDLASRKTEACGGGPIVSAMIAAEKLGANSVEITGYGDSGDTSGDKSSVVGYLSVLIYKNDSEEVYELDIDEAEIQDSPGTGAEFGLSTTDKKTLLDIARKSITSKLDMTEIKFSKEISPPLTKQLGAFVTLNKQGRLRGCIGTFMADQPLHKIIAKMAREAAFSDPRFPAVEKEELELLDIEISVLTPMKRISDPEAVEVGRDGLYIRQGMNSGVLLPQVPVEYNWDKKKFLEQTCLKAGLPLDAWESDKTELYVFQAEIFGEE